MLMLDISVFLFNALLLILYFMSPWLFSGFDISTSSSVEFSLPFAKVLLTLFSVSDVEFSTDISEYSIMCSLNILPGAVNVLFKIEIRIKFCKIWLIMLTLWQIAFYYFISCLIFQTIFLGPSSQELFCNNEKDRYKACIYFFLTSEWIYFYFDIQDQEDIC